MALTLTYDSEFARVVIEGSGLPDGYARVERSINQLYWETVRGGVAVPIEDGAFILYDDEFFDGVENYYRLAPSVQEDFVTPSSDQTNGDPWEVPTGVRSLTVEAWGAGSTGQAVGPPAAQNARPGGGGGAYIRSVIPVTPGETLRFRVGEGGDRNENAHRGFSGNHSTVYRGSDILAEARGSDAATGTMIPGTGGQASASIGDIKFSGGDGAVREALLGAGGGGGGSASAGGDGSDGSPGFEAVGGAGGAGQGPGGKGGDGYGGLVLDDTVSGDYALAPDAAPLDIVGDIDLRADVSLWDWTPTVQNAIISKYGTVGNQRSYRLIVNTTGNLVLTWSPDGTSAAALTRTSTAVAVPGSGGRLAIRATLDVNNGAAGHTVTFYTASTIDSAWTQLGAPVVTAGVTSIFAGTADLIVGAVTTAGTEGVNGIVHEVQVLNGIAGSVVADPDFMAQTTGTTAFADDQGNAWSLVGAALIRNDSMFGQDGQEPGGGGGGQGPLQGTLMSVPPAGSGNGADGRLVLNSWAGYPFTTAGMSLPGDPASYASTPDAAPLDITGDIDIRVFAQLDMWAGGGDQELMSKWAAGQQSWAFYVAADGTLNFTWSEDGTTAEGLFTSTAPVPAEFMTPLAVRVTMDVDNGTSGATLTFYTGDSVTGPWTQLGAPVINGAVTSFFAGTAPVWVGGAAYTDSATGTFLSAMMLDGIDGTAVATPDFSAQEPGTTVFVDSVGRTWTLNGDAEIIEPTGLTASILPQLDSVWLKSIRYPMLNRPIDCIDYSEINRAFRGGIFPIQGRSMPIAVTDLKGSRQVQYTLATESLEAARDMDLVLAANEVMFIHVPREDPLECERVSAVPGGYFAIGETTQTRAFNGSQIYQFTLPATEVVKPGPDIVSTNLTWGSVYNLYGSWEALIAANPTWLDLLLTMGSPEDLVVL